MSRFTERLKRLEAKHKPDDLGRILVFWDDGTPVTAGKMALAEYEAAYPDCKTIQMTWGDGDEDEA